MVIVDTLSNEIVKSYGEDVYSLLQIYEDVYPPDLSIELKDEPGMFDFNIFGGDIGVAGFYLNPKFDRIIHLATQDLLFRISTDRGSSVLFPSAGNTNISSAPRQAIEGIIAISAQESPYIEVINSIEIKDLEDDEIRINIQAETVTGDSIHIGFKI